ncbi:hypothetical protein MNBD_PLANCTO02-2398 [hydrothermal vent metagenome]|uniref:DUF3467 domain-containing protein n=1 Tax=hydrothermal vent metagenome TaxID=652676 RepID=A0A3B1D6F1_9ZZZZ
MTENKNEAGAKKQTVKQTTEGAGTEDVSIPLDRSNMVSGYANICLVMNTPEELILDFGLNTNPPQSNETPITISQRVILNYSHAQRLLQMLSMVVQRQQQAMKESIEQQQKQQSESTPPN